ncbi:MAG: ATP-binding protein [Planctomycetota bacterium]
MPDRSDDSTGRTRAWLMAMAVVLVAVSAIVLVLTVHGAAVPIAISACVITGLLGARQAWNVFRVRSLRSLARAYADGQLTRRAALSGSDGLVKLGHDLNQLGERLAAARDELESQRQLLDSALRSLAEGVACIDTMDRVVYANPAWRYLAAAGADVGNTVFYEYLPAAALAAAITTARTNGLPSPDGVAFEHRHHHLRATVTQASSGIIVVVLHDVTELLRLEGARREFVSSVSHELKTPLTAIVGFADTLLDGTLEEDPTSAREFVEKINRHAERLTVLVRDVLTLSRLEQGSWDLHPADIDLAAVVRAVAEEHQPAAADKHVQLRIEGPTPFPATSDRELLHQLLGNLLSNAIRYNRLGGTVTIGLVSLSDDRMRLTIQDTGIGIPTEHQARIFERFYRIDAHRSRQSGGTGLGLAIVKHLVGTLRGSISFVSTADGTTFTVDLPRRAKN